MTVSLHIRIENTVHTELLKMSEERGINISQLVRELLDIGMRVKKHMGNADQTAVPDEKIDPIYLEKGASAAIESLLLLRKIATNINVNWPIEAHREAEEKIKEFD